MTLIAANGDKLSIPRRALQNTLIVILLLATVAELVLVMRQSARGSELSLSDAAFLWGWFTGVTSVVGAALIGMFIFAKRQVK